jgi:hypothetical protein
MFVSDEWKTRPWAVAGRVKSPRQRVLDHAAHIPDLYLQFSHLRGCGGPGNQTSAIQALEDDIQRLLDDLHAWELHSIATGFLNMKAIPLTAREAKKLGFSHRHDFESLVDSGLTYLVYNTLVILITKLWTRVRLWSAPGSEGGLPTPTPEQSRCNSASLVEDSVPIQDLNGDEEITVGSLTQRTRTAALEICRTLPQFKTKERGWRYPFQLGPPIRMALLVCNQNGGRQQAEWLKDVVRENSSETHGWESGKYLMEQSGYDGRD